MRNALGINLIVNPEYATACEISRILRFSCRNQNRNFRKKAELNLLNLTSGSDNDFARKAILRYTKKFKDKTSYMCGAT